MPKYVCPTCWSIIDAFHELYQKSKTAQETYMNASIKTEQESDNDIVPNDIDSDNDDGITIDEPEIDIKLEQNFEETVTNTNKEDTRIDDSDNEDASFNIEDTTNDVTQQEQTPSIFQCDICKKKFKRKQSFIGHVKSHATVENEEQNQREKLIAENFGKCDFCDVIPVTLHEARYHYKEKHNVNDGYIKCCKLKLKTKCSIRDHIEFHLNPERFK